MSILLVAENISLRLSGETVLPYYYMDHFQRLGLDVRCVCHARVREQLRQDLSPDLFEGMTFIEDTWLQRTIFVVGKLFPYRVNDLVFNQIIHILTQIRMRSVVRHIITAHNVDVVFEPAPIAPKALSFMYRLGAPVVIGPMSGGMELPPAFREMDGIFVNWAIRASRRLAALLHRAVPGKLHAAALLVANQRTRLALPSGVRGRIVEIPESAVELERWTPKVYPVPSGDRPVRFIFCGRLVDWKGVQFLVKAFAPLAREGNVRLDVVGDGELFDSIREQVVSEGISDAVVLHGRLPLESFIGLLNQADVYVTPSLRECGGIAMLEAMAIGLPVIATKWGGAAQYATDECAFLVDPTSKGALVDGLTSAMRRLAASPSLRRSMGEAARQQIIGAELVWSAKARSIVKILSEVIADHQRSQTSGTCSVQSVRAEHCDGCGSESWPNGPNVSVGTTVVETCGWPLSVHRTA